MKKLKFENLSSATLNKAHPCPIWKENKDIMHKHIAHVLDGEARPHISFVFFIILKPPNCSELWNCL